MRASGHPWPRPVPPEPAAGWIHAMTMEEELEQSQHEHYASRGYCIWGSDDYKAPKL